MKTKIVRTIGLLGLIVATGSLSACFDESFYPAYHGYAYSSPRYGYPQYQPHYFSAYVPAPHYYVPDPPHYGQYAHHWKHEEHEEHEGHDHHHHDRS